MRRPDWQPRLMDALHESAHGEFAYGTHDCAIGAARVADAISVDSHYVQRLHEMFAYANAEEVEAILRDGGGLRRLVTEFLGQQPIPVGHAMAGDLALVTDLAGQRVLGICEGLQVICAGVGPLPMSQAICAWRIG